MKEKNRISDLYRQLYNGKPWIDVTIAGTLKKINAAKAAKRVSPKLNTIWEITLHLISWRKNVLERMQGKVIVTPAHNYFLKVGDTSPEAWLNTLKQFDKVQEDWLQYLDGIKKSDLEKVYEPNSMTNYTQIQGILQHDAYHLGQIVLLAKMIR